MKTFAIFLSLLLFHYVAIAQAPTQSYLNELDDEELLSVFIDFENDSLAQEKIARTYLQRGIKEGDTIKIARGYDRLARSFSPKTNIKYADSLIEYTKDWDHIYFSSIGYILKGFEYSRIEDIKNTFYNYLKADSIAEVYKSFDVKAYVLERIAHEYLHLESPDKALEFERKRQRLILKDEYFKSLIKSSRNNDIKNINSLIRERKISSYMGHLTCFIQKGKIDSARYYRELMKRENYSYVGYLKNTFNKWMLDSKMEIEYFSGNYANTITLADSIMKIIKQDEDLHYLKNSNLFKGLALFHNGNFERAERFLLAADSIYNFDKSISYVFYDRLLFSSLFKLYKNKNDLNNQIVYLDKQLYLDSISRVKTQYFFPEVVSRFETKQLLKERGRIISELEDSNKKSHLHLLILGLILLCTVGIAFFYYRKQLVYKKRFKYLVTHTATEKDNTVTPHKNLIDGIPIGTVSEIKAALYKFEQSKGFLQKEITLQYLAKKFNTNTNYLSRILNFTTNKNFSKYINDLRINHVIKEIKDNPNYKKYSINAIAKECGYTSGASFSRVFYKKTGIYPSYFIKQMSKTNYSK